MDNYHYTPSELIDLALDCELDTSQATTLFELLSRDNSLQVEFRQAVAIRRALSNDVIASIPSLEFTNNLFQRAGVELPVEATSSITAQSGLKWSSLAGTAIVFLGIGLIISLLLNRFYDVQTKLSNFPVFLPKIYTMYVGKEKTLTSYNNSRLLNNTENTLSPFHTPTYHHIQKASKGTTDGITILSENNETEQSVGPASVEISTIVPQSKLKTISNKIIGVKEELSRLLMIDYSKISEDKSNTSLNIDKGISLQIRGIFGGMLFNNQSSVVPSPPLMNNLGVTLKYDLNENHTIGIEVGQESFPSMIETSDGRLQPTSTIAWTGIIYQYSLPKINKLGNLRPFIQTVSGGTGFGPIAKGIIGVSLPIKNKMSFFTAAEGTVMGYRYHSNWYSAQKISFCTGMMLTF
ncbi:MAG: hypothetical protein IPM69_14400 [Ignavibacteria bacterium]|nr:hypothetical protein [Ignavibacteria bacterium]